MSLAGGPRWPVPLPTDPRKADAALVALARQGETWAFEALYVRHESEVYGYLFQLLRTGPPSQCGRIVESEARQDTCDLMQDVFLKAWQALPGTYEGTNFVPWIHRIALRSYLDLFRRRKNKEWLPWQRFVSRFHPAQVAPASVEEEVQAGELSEEIQRVLALLPLHYRTGLILREYQGLAYGDIAEAMDRTTCSVKSLIFRAREAFAAAVRHDANLRARFAAYGYVPQAPAQTQGYAP